MAGTPKRASAAEHALRGQPWTLERVQAAQQALLEDFDPLTDWRGSAAYRMQAAQNLLLRFFLETQDSSSAHFPGHFPVQLQRGSA
jgi:xanthine dehydrogenase small subunit